MNAVSTALGLMQEASRTAYFDGPVPVFGEAWLPSIFNFIQLAVAAIRIDLGNPSPNNLLMHPEVLNRTLTETFPEIGAIDLESMPSKLYTHLKEQSLLVSTDSGSMLDTLSVPGPSVVQTVQQPLGKDRDAHFLDAVCHSAFRSWSVNLKRCGTYPVRTLNQD